MMSSGRRAKIRAPRKNLQKTLAFDDLWPKLALSIEQIHDENASQLSFEELYRTAYTLVLRKNGERLYNSVNQKISELLGHVVSKSFGSRIQMAQSSSIPSENIRMDVLKTLQRIWADHCVCMRMVSDILMYLDRAYSREMKLPLVYDAGLMIFRDTVLRSPQFAVSDFVHSTIIHEIKRERDGEAIDRMAIKPIISMLETLPEARLESESMYIAEFEPLFIESSEEYYSNAAAKLLESTNDASLYLKKVNEWIESERLRCGLYLLVSTGPKLMPKVEKALITDRIESVMLNPDSGFKYWVDNCSFDNLSLLYHTTAYIDKSFTLIQQHMKQRIIESGTDINSKADSLVEEAKSAKMSRNRDRSAMSGLSPTAISIKWVEDILQLKEKMDKILKVSFLGDTEIEKAAQSGFTEFLNKNTRAAEFLSLFIDDNLKKSAKGKTEAEVEEILNNAVLLFRYISEKDLFESYYKAHLAKRLLNGKSLSMEAEMNMVGKIKMEMGTAFTSKLEGMFRDMRISRELLGGFKDLKKKQGSKSSIEMNVNILTSTHWPTSVVTSQVKCILPKELEQAKQEYETFYFSKHNGRLLSWNPSLGTVDVRIKFSKRAHEVNMPTLTFVVMMLFNALQSNEYLTYDDIKASTGLPDTELVRHLQSVAIAPRTRLLRKEPMSREISGTDKFYFNEGFESSMVRIKVLAVSANSRVENDSEKKETMERLNEARKYEIEAAIVRIMKARKSLEHAQLLGDVSRQLMKRFRPEPAQIKLRIDALIEREYLERNPQNRTSYTYLA